MNLYAESSAILAWLLAEEDGVPVQSALAAAERVTASELTLLECDRTLIRAVTLGELSETEAVDRRRQLGITAASWYLLQIGQEIVSRARQPFPNEPIRSLDAIHLASALIARSASPGLEILSLDQRIRISAAHLGFRVQPQ